MANKAWRFPWLLALISCFVLLQAATPRHHEYNAHRSAAQNSAERLMPRSDKARPVRRLSTGGGHSGGSVSGSSTVSSSGGSGAGGGSSTVPKQAGAGTPRRHSAAASGRCHATCRLVACAVAAGVAFLAST